MKYKINNKSRKNNIRNTKKDKEYGIVTRKSKKNKKTIKMKNKRQLLHYKKKKIKNGGSKIYIDGEIHELNEYINGKPFFRKQFYYSEPPTDEQIQSVKNEISIVQILIDNPHPNIVTYFDVNDKYVDMEELNINYFNPHEIIKPMKDVKQFLQNLGIMYVDWKLDNIGLANDGNYKLFDFDCSGLIDLETGKWILEPMHYYSYNAAIKNGSNTPKEIDDWTFDYNILRIKQKIN